LGIIIFIVIAIAIERQISNEVPLIVYGYGQIRPNGKYLNSKINLTTTINTSGATGFLFV
jgi:hypothetical protein